MLRMFIYREYKPSSPSEEPPMPYIDDEWRALRHICRGAVLILAPSKLRS
ncbi:hypothetical protein COLO4_14187 [Corchorus olitorius]|uniref:Uncharacterized protein n=1 Tax=Corchorus olitorius TaxID=93759 RepID=A0A1R3JT84_9ROSI|nr:hypothetical protein COLO4_14187 [Corchorus olitorius]